MMLWLVQRHGWLEQTEPKPKLIWKSFNIIDLFRIEGYPGRKTVATRNIQTAPIATNSAQIAAFVN